jgi:hypothetical protein
MKLDLQAYKLPQGDLKLNKRPMAGQRMAILRVKPHMPQP